MQQYPLELTFKFWSLSPSLTITDNQNNTLMHVQQRLFKLKELIHVFADTQRNHEIYNIKADRIIDWSARYDFANEYGQAIGAVKRRGRKSIWKAHYDVFDGDNVAFTIQEENPWVKVFDALFAEIPIVGMFTGYVFNPVYIVARPDGREVMRLSKVPSLLSRIFTIKAKDELNATEEPQVLLSLIMLLLLERRRG